MDYYVVCLSKAYYRNRMFDAAGAGERDDVFYPFRVLRQTMAARGSRLDTYDYCGSRGDSGYGLIFFDIPGDWRAICAKHPAAPKYLVVFEPEIIWPANWDARNHGPFRKVFTWNDSWIDDRKYFKFCLPNRLAESVRRDPGNRSKLVTMIAGHKLSGHPAELYSSRIAAIRWFERNHPEDFDLYGMGWDRRTFVGIKPVRALNRLDFLRRLLAPRYPSYRGPVVAKREVLERYRFAICYENMRDVPGYISEKLFDCFNAGCIPVYRGANNVSDAVPADCFVDMRQFPGFDELYRYIRGLSNAEYLGCLDRIAAFLQSDAGQRFSAASFARTIADGVAGG